MNSTNEALEARLHVVEVPIADDGFSEAVLASLPPKRLSARTARCLSFVIAAAIGSLITLLGASPEILPPEILPPVLAESGAIVTSLLTSAAVVALFMVPLAWLIYAEMADGQSRSI